MGYKFAPSSDLGTLDKAILTSPTGSLLELSKNIKGHPWEVFMDSAWMQPIKLLLHSIRMTSSLWPPLNTRKAERFPWLYRQEEEDNECAQLADCIMGRRRPSGNSALLRTHKFLLYMAHCLPPNQRPISREDGEHEVEDN